MGRDHVVAWSPDKLFARVSGGGLWELA